MFFETEPAGYEKTVLSDLQGAWKNLREAVVEHTGFAGWDCALLRIDKAMSWESVSNLQCMNRSLRLVCDVVMQGEAPEEVALYRDEVNRLMDETLQVLREGKMN